MFSNPGLNQMHSQQLYDERLREAEQDRLLRQAAADQEAAGVRILARIKRALGAPGHAAIRPSVTPTR